MGIFSQGIGDIAAPAKVVRDSGFQLLVDSDYLAYLVAFISQHKARTDADDDATQQELSDGSIVWIDSEEAVISRLQYEISKLKDRLKTDDMRLFISGSGNFRYDVAKTKKYKGNRSGSVKPYFYHRLMEQLVTMGAEISDGNEADDEVSIAQFANMHREQLSCIVSPDGDLANTPGFLYNPKREQLLYVTPEAGQRHLMTQMIIGDTSDNIPGLPRAGKVAARMLDEVEPDDLESFVFDMYHRRKHDLIFAEQLQLLHMQRAPGERRTYGYDFRDGHVDQRHLVSIPFALTTGESKGR